jgi:metal-responsive CopG/Arc/MetJ family transcriptional regulator
MNRKTSKTGTKGVHITLPIRMCDEFDEKVGYKNSRSAKIAQLMGDWVRGHDDPLDDYACIEILEHLQYRYEKDSSEDILIQALLALS